jgi:multidrug/hemolysin transport system permease protein
MRILTQLVKRNLLLYLRDKASVFFSFLSVIIIIVMYMLFIGRLQRNGMISTAGDVAGLDWLVSSWIMAGILTVTTVTVPLGALGTMITDRQTKKISDFYTAPIDRKILALSYLVSAWVIGFIMVTVNLFVGQLYVLSQGGEFLGFIQLIKIFGMIILSIMSFSTFFYYLSLLMKTANAFSLLSTLVGTFIGFLGGIYVQIGLMPKLVQSIMNTLPTAHSVVMIRRIYMDGAIEKVFQGYTGPEYVEFMSDMGLTATVFGFELQSYHMILSLVLFGLFFYGLSVLRLNKSKL